MEDEDDMVSPYDVSLLLLVLLNVLCLCFAVGYLPRCARAVLAVVVHITTPVFSSVISTARHAVLCLSATASNVTRRCWRRSFLSWLALEMTTVLSACLLAWCCNHTDQLLSIADVLYAQLLSWCSVMPGIIGHQLSVFLVELPTLLTRQASHLWMTGCASVFAIYDALSLKAIAYWDMTGSFGEQLDFRASCVLLGLLLSPYWTLTASRSVAKLWKATWSIVDIYTFVAIVTVQTLVDVCKARLRFKVDNLPQPRANYTPRFPLDPLHSSSNSASSPNTSSPSPHTSPEKTPLKHAGPGSQALPAPKPGPQPGSPACLLKARLVAVEAEKEALEAEKAAYLLTNSRLACQMADKTIKWVKADDAISELKSDIKRLRAVQAAKQAQHSADSSRFMSELRHLLGITGQKAILATISLLQKDSANLSEAVSANAGAEQSLSSAKSKIHTLEQQLKSKQAAATAAQSLLAGEKTSRSALMRELRQCNDELIDSQAESADMRTQAQHANAKSAVLTKQLKSAQKAALDAQTESADMQKQAQNADAKLPVLNEQLQCAQKSASDTQMRNAELERKLESAMEELASLKTKNSSAKVINISADASCFAAPHSRSGTQTAFSSSSSTSDSCAQTEPVKMETASIDNASQELQSCKVQVAELEATNKEREKGLEILQERSAMPKYPLCTGWIWGESIGKGRNGSVYPVKNPVTTETVFKSGSQSELENEGQLLHEVNHPNIIQSFGMFYDEQRPGLCWLAVEQMQCTLEDVMKTRRLTVMEIVRGLYELASGLDHMHDRGIADQDVQRGNVLISFTNSTWKKGDLGSAARCRIIGAYNWLDAKKCRIAFGVESPDLAAMLIKHGRYMPRAAWDLWALGLLALDLVGGERPEDHRDVLLAPVYMAEAMAGIRDPLGLPGQRGQMEYLAAHVTHESSYADKVLLLLPEEMDPPLQDNEAAPYEVLKAVIRGCLAATAETRLEAFEVAFKLFHAAKDAGWL